MRLSFIEFLVTRYRGPHTHSVLSDGSARGYAKIAGDIEAALSLNLDVMDFRSGGVDRLVSQLRARRYDHGFSDTDLANFGSALRAYAQFLGSTASLQPTDVDPFSAPGSAALGQGTAMMRAPAIETPDPLMADLPVKQILALHAGLIAELRRRKIVRTSNNPVADYTETLFARAFGWVLETSSAVSFDAKDERGARYQIKGRRLTPENPSRQLSAIRRLPDQGFDYLAAVLFNPDFSVMRGVILPHEHVEPRGKFRAHVNAWLFHLDDRVWDLPGARDVTAELREAAERL